MKTDLSKQTKYFRKTYNKEKNEFELIEIPLNHENWFYVQIDATIRTAFLKYNFPLPKYVIIEELSHLVIFNVFRSTISNIKDLLHWQEKYICIYSDLKQQAECNSVEKWEDIENFVKFEFKLL